MNKKPNTKALPNWFSINKYKQKDRLKDEVDWYFQIGTRLNFEHICEMMRNAETEEDYERIKEEEMYDQILSQMNDPMGSDDPDITVSKISLELETAPHHIIPAVTNLLRLGLCEMNTIKKSIDSDREHLEILRLTIFGYLFVQHVIETTPKGK